jgi:hypothetical protein
MGRWFASKVRRFTGFITIGPKKIPEFLGTGQNHRQMLFFERWIYYSGGI